MCVLKALAYWVCALKAQPTGMGTPSFSGRGWGGGKGVPFDSREYVRLIQPVEKGGKGGGGVAVCFGAGGGGGGVGGGVLMLSPFSPFNQSVGGGGGFCPLSAHSISGGGGGCCPLSAHSISGGGVGGGGGGAYMLTFIIRAPFSPKGGGGGMAPLPPLWGRP